MIPPSILNHCLSPYIFRKDLLKIIFFIEENLPCVGICQHNKQKCDEDEQCVDYDKGTNCSKIRKKMYFWEITIFVSKAKD